ncbi:MAG: DUF2683 family protein [Mucilaginibacter sp.]|uniref:DUF2683 family protein n=1 Tax=Mucilaginibacter sp. TaxID=1882438 RepID=UPI003264E08B
MELLLKNVDPKDFTLLYDLAQRLGIQVEAKDDYDPEFVAKILKSKQQATEGKVTVISVEDLWK